MTPDSAQTVGLQALAWLVGNEELLPVFLGSTGADAGTLAEQAADPVFLASVLEFLTMDDAWVTAFCDASDLGYDIPLRARQALPGGALPNWT